jgi:hypothetical protein
MKYPSEISQDHWSDADVIQSTREATLAFPLSDQKIHNSFWVGPIHITHDRPLELVYWMAGTREIGLSSLNPSFVPGFVPSN